MAQSISVNQFRENSPERYARVGAMLEDFICNHTSITDLSLTHKLSSYSVNFFIKQYFGNPREPFIVDIEVHREEIKPIPIKISNLHKEYMTACMKVDLLRDAIDKLENNL
jgi:hypothetical protein